jgi:hypothetical protein
MMNCALTITMGQVCVVQRLFMLLRLITFGGLVEKVGSPSHDCERRDGDAPKSLTSGSPNWTLAPKEIGRRAKLYAALTVPDSCDLRYLKSNRISPSAEQVNDQDHQSHNQEQVDQAAADMQAETQEPQNHQNNENRPQHIDASVPSAAPDARVA